MASRKRIRHCKDSPGERDLNDENDDEEADKEKRYQLRLFRYAWLYAERFCSIPISSVTGRVSSRHSRVSLMSSPLRQGARQSRLKCILLPLFLCGLIPWLSWNHRHYPGHDESYRSLERVQPLVIRLMFEYDTDSSQQYRSHLKNSHKPDYNGLHIEPLRNNSVFERQIDINYDYERNEVHRRKMMKLHRGTPSEHFEEFLDLECRRQNWYDLYFPNCNSFHEFNEGRWFDPYNLGYYDCFPIRYVHRWFHV